MKQQEKFVPRFMVKPGIIHFNDVKMKMKIRPNVWYDLPHEALTTPGKVGYEALHDRLAQFATIHKFELPSLVNQLAHSSLFRMVYCVRDYAIPRYVVTQIFDMLVSANACVWEGAALRKTTPYVMFLRQIVPHESTMASVSSKSVSKYRVPDDIGEMTSIMLQEEIRFAEECDAKPKVIERLQTRLHAQQAIERESPTKKGKKKTEFEQLQDVMREARAEDVTLRVKTRSDDEAQYDDVQPSKTRRKSP